MALLIVSTLTVLVLVAIFAVVRLLGGHGAQDRGNDAAFVLPPAVGARSSASTPSRTGPTAASRSGRIPGQPRDL